MQTARIRLSEFIYLLQGQWHTRVIMVVNLLLVLWVGYQLMQFIQLFMPVHKDQDRMQPDSVVAANPTKQTSQLLVEHLAEIHLFGEPVTEQDPIEKKPIEAPDTRLKIVLRGTISSDDSQSTHAIIADASGKEESYTIGDEVPGGIKVHEILADRVILTRRQSYETLRLLRNDIKGVIITPELTSSQKVARSSGSDILPTLNELPVSLNDLVSPQPVRVEGKFIGFRLKPLKDSRLLDKLGLQRGDVITWINEVDLDNPMKGMQALNKISSGDYVNMNLRRNGQDISLSFYMP
jgi:general secretion pathway protein C